LAYSAYRTAPAAVLWTAAFALLAVLFQWISLLRFYRRDACGNLIQSFSHPIERLANLLDNRVHRCLFKKEVHSSTENTFHPPEHLELFDHLRFSWILDKGDAISPVNGKNIPLATAPLQANARSTYARFSKISQEAN